MINANALSIPLASGSVQCVVTSPPYYGLRDYQTAGQIGLEQTPEEYVANMVQVFREVWRVLRDDGTAFLNLGDSFCDKQLLGIPWRVAFALQADGWYLRQDIIWAKAISGETRRGSAMPESVRDRFCKSHEYLFLLTKSPRYYFDQIAVCDNVYNNETHEYNCVHENKNLQYMQNRKTGNGFQQEQSTYGRTGQLLQSLPFGEAQGMGSQIQQIREGKESAGSVLLFREGADNQKGLSPILSDDGRAAGKIPPGGEASRERTQVQSQDAPLLGKREGQGDQSQERQEIRQYAKRKIRQAEGRDKTQASDQNSRLHINNGGLADDQGTPQQSMRLLWETATTPGNGSCNTLEQRGKTYSGQYSPILQNLQREKEQQIAIRRSVWLIHPQPTPFAHFATMPEKLVEPCILAGTSERGACPKCGAPWVRMIDRTPPGKHDSEHQTIASGRGNGADRSKHAESGLVTTLGWQPSCDCNAGDPVPCVVYDPFAGSGTVQRVAIKHGRRGIGTELNYTYVRDIARRRTSNVQVRMI